MKIYYLSIFALTLTMVPLTNNNANYNLIEPMIYHLNDPLFHIENGKINDYTIDDNIEMEPMGDEPSEILEPNSIIPTIPITPPYPPAIPPTIPSIYDGDLNVPYFNQINFVKNYYENLNQNFPINNVGNCGYVAISLLLQYYDVYWNNNFIPNSYNNDDKCQIDSLGDALFESPGVDDIYLPLWTDEHPEVQESDPDYEEKYNAAMRQYILDMMAGDSFVGYLYSIGVDLGYIVLNSNNVGTGVSYDVVRNVLAEYIELNNNINDYVSVKSYKLSDFNNDESELRNAVIEKLEIGQPLILGGGLSTGGGHVTIAYYYDDQNDVIYGHSGWKNPGSSHSNSFVNLDQLFGEMADFYYIDVLSGLNHTHNKIFQVTNETNSSSYCNCELDSHICGFYDFPYNDDNYHIHQCLCDFDYVEHEFVWISSDTKQCTLCRVMISNPSVQN